MTDEKFIKIVNESISMSYACKQVGMSFNTFKKRALCLNCYKPNPSGKGMKKPIKKKIKTQEILEGLHSQYQTFKLKIRLIEESIFEDKCSICGWCQKPDGAKFTPCELDHKDGNPTNHKLANLQIICPNCHSLTKSYRFRRGKTNEVEHREEKSLE